MQKEREISLIEILIAVLKKWKLIVILALILAILLGGAHFIKVNGTVIKSTESTNVANKLTKEEYIQQCDSYQTRIDMYSKKVDELNKHVQESYALKIDSYNCATASSTCIFYGNPVHTEAAAATMISTINGIDYNKAIITRNTEIEGIEGQYIDELVSVSTPIDDVVVNAPRFTISVVAADQNTAETILNNLISYIESKQSVSAKFIQNDPDFGWEYSPVISKTGYSSSLTSYQNALLSNTNTAVDTLAKAESSLIELKKTYSSYYGKNSEKLPETKKVSAIAAAKGSVTYAIYGLLIGIVLGVVIAFCQVFFSPNLYNSRQLQDDADLKFIGSIENTDFVKGLQKLLKRISGDKEFLSPSLERTAYTAARLVPLAKDGKILVTGTADTADIEKAIAALKNAEPSLNLVFKGNLTVSSAAVKELEDAVGILVMEQTDKSKLKPISSLLEVCRFTGKDIIGYIMI